MILETITQRNLGSSSNFAIDLLVTLNKFLKYRVRPTLDVF